MKRAPEQYTGCKAQKIMKIVIEKIYFDFLLHVNHTFSRHWNKLLSTYSIGYSSL